MINKSKYLKKSISTLSLGVILLVNSSLALALANETSDTKAEQSQSVQVTKQAVVNLNKSSVDQLVTLKGIGETKAQAIIAYRQQFGGFKSINELSKVRGIGEKIIKENQARLSI
ncbi:ComEA family DNA-binding protein [Colwellia piezophila]|uniref:ComEA family DNA-binding protein n=1 Tax=Colwellia piezophila TaxID=211668 RepID=UPI0003801156|nr:helix-hairpin-helix domain-containing protein [Colwellia piezophila]